MEGKLWIFFAFGAALCWGTYGPALHAGQDGFTDSVRVHKSLRALLCVGGAYFVAALLIPSLYLYSKGALSGFTVKGTVFSFLTGFLGAGGAICITWAFKNGGKPFYVMPLVFAGAPVLTGIISLLTQPPEGGWRRVHPLTFVGILMAAAGAYLILAFKDRSWGGEP